MDILLQDLRFALRSLRRSLGFTTVVVAVLALGIGVNTMIFSMVYGCMFRPWPMPGFDRVMTVVESNKAKDEQHEGVSWLNFQDLRERSKSFEVVAGFWDTGGQITIGAMYPLPCVAIANDDHGSLAMLRRRALSLGRSFGRKTSTRKIRVSWRAPGCRKSW